MFEGSVVDGRVGIAVSDGLLLVYGGMTTPLSS